MTMMMMTMTNGDDFCNDNVPALSSDVLMAAVVRLLPFTAATAPLSPPKLRVQLFAFVKLLRLILVLILFKFSLFEILFIFHSPKLRV